MEMDNALNLQAEVFKTALGFEELPSVSLTGGAPVLVDPALIDATSARKRSLSSAPRRTAEDIAIGISKLPGDDGVRLAVLLQNRADRLGPELSRISEIARGEIEPIYIGRQRLFWTKTRNDPIRLGCSVSPVTVAYAGTLGCFCRDNYSQAIGILSNNHVLADLNRIPTYTDIMQQAVFDNGNPAQDVIARLSRYVHIQFGGIPNMVDAAFAELISHGRREERQMIFDGVTVPTPVTGMNAGSKVSAFPGNPVMKTGRTTGHTKGRVRAINVNNLLVNTGIGIARFDGQISFDALPGSKSSFSQPGDSGSLIVDPQGQPMALLFAGSASGGTGNLGITHGTPILTVEAQLGVTLV